MKTTRGMVVKLQISEKDKNYLIRMLGSKRVIWNEALAYKKELFDTYKRRNPCVDNKDEKKIINDLGSNSTIQKVFAKKELVKYEGYEYLLDVPSKVVQQLLNDLDSVFKGFYKGENGYPKFKKKNDPKQSIRFLDGLGLIKLNSKTIGIKIGRMVLQGLNPERGNHKLFSTEIHNITLSKDNLDGFYTSICYSFEQIEPTKVNDDYIGLDMGITDSVSTSDGEFYNLPCSLKTAQTKRQVLQRRYKNKTKGSRSWKKLKFQIAKLYKKETYIRKDFHHKLSDKLTKTHGFIVHEDLKIKNMSQSAKGTVEKNGKNVDQKSGLNREILNQGWGTLFNFLEYKGKQRGVEVIRVAPQGTSQICSSCCHKDPQSRNGKHFECTSCGFKIDADINGAKNILTRGQREIAGRGTLTQLKPLTPELEITLLE